MKIFLDLGLDCQEEVFCSWRNSKIDTPRIDITIAIIKLQRIG
jgi:hypothetical protein